MEASSEMDQKIAEILASLPAKVPRSRLEPYRELIREMRRRGRTYREIAGVLGKRCGVRVAASSVHDYVRRRARVKPGPEAEAGAPIASTLSPTLAAVEPGKRAEPPVRSMTQDQDELRQRIDAIKQRPAPAAGGPAKPVFTYNEDEPLRVGKAGGR